MTSESNLTVANLALVGVEELKKKWGWFLALGILLIIIGTVALGSAFTMTVFSMVSMGNGAATDGQEFRRCRESAPLRPEEAPASS